MSVETTHTIDRHLSANWTRDEIEADDIMEYMCQTVSWYLKLYLAWTIGPWAIHTPVVHFVNYRDRLYFSETGGNETNAFKFAILCITDMHPKEHWMECMETV